MKLTLYMYRTVNSELTSSVELNWFDFQHWDQKYADK